MKDQITFADIEYGSRKRSTRRDRLLLFMDAILPWDEITKLLASCRPGNRTGRPARDTETLYRMVLLQKWYGLSDDALEDAIYDSYAMRSFLHLDFGADSVPDPSTLYRFRKKLAKTGTGDACEELVKAAMKENHCSLRPGCAADPILTVKKAKKK